MDLFRIGSCDLLRLQCQTAVIELILTLIRKNNTVFLPPEHLSTEKDITLGTHVCVPQEFPAANKISSAIPVKINPS